MGYVDSAPYFCCERETVADLANISCTATTNTSLHPILALVDTPPDTEDNDHTGTISSNLDASIATGLPPSSPVALLSYVNVYADNFIKLA